MQTAYYKNTTTATEMTTSSSVPIKMNTVLHGSLDYMDASGMLSVHLLPDTEREQGRFAPSCLLMTPPTVDVCREVQATTTYTVLCAQSSEGGRLCSPHSQRKKDLLSARFTPLFFLFCFLALPILERTTAPSAFSPAHSSGRSLLGRLSLCRALHPSVRVLPGTSLCLCGF